MSDPAVFIECFRCGYDLHGIPDDRPCPECGLLAERSRRATDALRDARPSWLRGLSLGIWLCLAGFAAAFLSPVLADELRARFGTILFVQIYTYHDYFWGVAGRLLFSLGIIWLLPLIGAFLLTRPEGYPPADTADARRRRWIRILVCLPVFVLIACLFSTWLTQLGGSRRTTALLFVVLLLSLVPLPWLMMRQLESLAYRTRSANIAEHCRIVGTGTSLTLLSLPVVYLLYIFPLGNLSLVNGFATLYILLIITTAGSLFWLWLIFLATRFAISFRRASRESHQKWTAADMALRMNDQPR